MTILMKWLQRQRTPLCRMCHEGQILRNLLHVQAHDDLGHSWSIKTTKVLILSRRPLFHLQGTCWRAVTLEGQKHQHTLPCLSLHMLLSAGQISLTKCSLKNTGSSPGSTGILIVIPTTTHEVLPNCTKRLPLACILDSK